MNRVLFLIFLFAPMSLHANFWNTRGAGVVIPKPIPGFKTGDYSFLAGTLVMETRDLSVKHPGRGLIFWIKDPSKLELKEYVSCIDYVVGSRYNGSPYVSLVDLSTHKLIQNMYFELSGLESSTVPFRIQQKGLYSVHGTKNKLGEKETVLLDPVQVDGDPNSEEYAFFETQGGCFCPVVIAYGYDSKKDSLFRFKVIDYSYVDNVPKRTQSEFLYDLFFIANLKPGQNQYDFVTKEGHGSDKFTLHRYKYDFTNRTFCGISIDLTDDENNNSKYLGNSDWTLTPEAHLYLDKWWKNIKPQTKLNENGKKVRINQKI